MKSEHSIVLTIRNSIVISTNTDRLIVESRDYLIMTTEATHGQARNIGSIHDHKSNKDGEEDPIEIDDEPLFPSKGIQWM